MAGASTTPTTSTTDGDGENILDTLASIKSQVSSVLLHLQQAKISATASANIEQKEVSQMDSAQSQPPKGPPPATDIPLSREEVKAQREAAKAAKAARKNKSLGKATETPDAPQTSQKLDNTSPPKTVAQPSVNQVAKGSGSKSKGKKPKPEGATEPVVKNDDATSKKTASNSGPTPAQDSSNKGPCLDSANPPVPTSEGTTPNQQQVTSSGMSKDAVVPPPPEKPSTDIPPAISKQSAAEQQFLAELELVHPSFRELGQKYKNYVILGSNNRTLGMLNAVKQFIQDYKIPDGKEFKQDISVQLKMCLDKLKYYRPFAVGMTGAIEGLNGHIRALKDSYSEDECKDSLEEWCDTFIEEKIQKAKESISLKGCEKIQNGDTILVFSITDVIHEVLRLAGKAGKKFHLLYAITNSDTYIHDYKQIQNSIGAQTFRENIKVSCINISSVMSFIASVDKVFIGGHALFTTGGVMARAGSSMIALCASQHNIPVLFFCETYKFCDKSPTDAFYSDVFPENYFGFSSDFGSDQVTNYAKILYDVTPVNLVTCVITDVDMLPSSSVPVVLRVQESRPLTKCS